MSASFNGLKNPWVIIGVLAIILIGGSVWYSGSVQDKNNEGIVIKENVKGGENATVTLTEYSDFQCPACAAFQPVVKDILDEFPDELKLEYKHFPLPIHALSEVAARAAEAAGQQDAFFAYHDLLFENQATWSKAPNPTILFYQYATDLGLDLELFKRHFNSSVLRNKVKEDSVHARSLGLSGTPTFFLNGERMNIETYEDFRDQIAAAVNPDIVFDLKEEVQ